MYTLYTSKYGLVFPPLLLKAVVELFPKPPLAQGPRGHLIHLLDSQNISHLRPKGLGISEILYFNILRLKVPLYIFNTPPVQGQAATQEKKCFGEQAAKLELLVSCPQSVEIHIGRPTIPVLRV